MKRLSLRAWISIITFILIGLILFFSRHELNHAFHLLGRVDIWVLLLLVPVILIGYLAVGEMVFSYLRQKGYIKEVSKWTLMRISLELNFVNHVLPSGGVSGVSYMNWRLGKFGVPSGRATVAQGVRYVAGFASMAVLLVIAVIFVTIDGTINRWIVLMSSTLVSLMVIATLAIMYLFTDESRMHRIARSMTRTVNNWVRRASFGRIPLVVSQSQVMQFLDDMYDDYKALMRDKKVLVRPFLWGIFFTVTEIAIFVIVFWALGSPVNPAPILIAYGLATLAGFIVVTPGGAGAYEAIMVTVLGIAGMHKGEAIAGIVLTRAIILFVTIVVGWALYQQAVMKYGKRSQPHLER